MTSVSSILVGNFAFAAVFVAYYLTLTITGQARGGFRWDDSRPMRLAFSMALFVSGCVLFIVAASTAPTIPVVTSSTYLVWSAWGILWLAELTALSAIGRVAPAFCTCMLWTAYTLATRFSL